LSPQQNGQWKESLLASFKPLDPRGAEPYGGLIVDPSGRLYGTTQSGGRYGRLGTAFNLSLNGGKWVLSVIHKFGGAGDPTCCPWSDLLRDSSGNLYGTGDSVFELSPGPAKWKESILHEFRGKNGDGAGPQAGPIRDADGNLYGTTLYGGGSRVCADGCGTVWQLSPPALASGTGNWTEHILHRFGFSHNEAFPGWASWPWILRATSTARSREASTGPGLSIGSAVSRAAQEWTKPGVKPFCITSREEQMGASRKV